VFTSGSTVRGLVTLGRQESVDVRAIPAVCIGSETADLARAAGFRIFAVSATPAADALAKATAEALELQPQETS
jgi:uroporphyrinogen-III synthase